MNKIFLPLFIGILLIVSTALLRVTAHDARKNDVTISIVSPNSASQEISYSAEVLSNNPDVKIWPLWIELCLFGPFSLILLSVGAYFYSAMNDVIEFLKGVAALIATVITAITLVVFTGISFSESMKKAESVVQPTPTIVVISTPTPIPLDKNQNLYYLDIDIQAPEVIAQGQSDIIEVSMGIFDAPPKDSKLQPIGLFRNNVFYGIPEIHLVNFSLSSESNTSDNRRRMELNKTTTWNWVLTPTDIAEGNQSILWNIAIDDGRNKDELFLVSLTVRIDVKPKYGIPSFLLNPNFSLGGLLLGLLTTALGVGNLLQKREEDQKRARQEAEKQERDIEEARTKIFNILIALKNSEGGILFLKSRNEYDYHLPRISARLADFYVEASKLMAEFGIPNFSAMDNLIGIINHSTLPTLESSPLHADMVCVFLIPDSDLKVPDKYSMYGWEKPGDYIPSVYSEIFKKSWEFKREDTKPEKKSIRNWFVRQGK